MGKDLKQTPLRGYSAGKGYIGKSCTRCGRNTHSIEKCFANTHFDPKRTIQLPMVDRPRSDIHSVRYDKDLGRDITTYRSRGGDSVPPDPNTTKKRLHSKWRTGGTTFILTEDPSTRIRSWKVFSEDKFYI